MKTFQKEEQKDITCAQCVRSFTENKSLYRHLRTFHQIEPLDKKDPKFICEICNHKYSSKSNLSYHMKKYHKNEYGFTSIRNSRLICPIQSCNESFVTYQQLRTHLHNDHRLEIESEELKFTSMKDFETWKNAMELQTPWLYALDTARKPLVNGAFKLYYNCHRSYSSKSKGERVKKCSYKINKACPSRLEVHYHENNGDTELLIKFWKTHYGHGAYLDTVLLDEDSTADISGFMQLYT